MSNQWNFATSWLPGVTPAPLSIRVITHNIRYAAQDLSKNERPWEDRAPLVIQQLQHEMQPTIAPTKTDSPLAQTLMPYSGAFICLQEVLHRQLVDVLAGLNNIDAIKGDTEMAAGPTWEHIGVGRDDGQRKGEYSPILYPVKLFKPLHNQTMWLSPTPDMPSKGWDADSIRIMTFGVFEHLSTKRLVLAANTHLDNTGKQSRLESVDLIIKTLKRVHNQWAGNQSVGVVLTGDFNSFPTQEAYIALKANGWFRDLHGEVDEKYRYGDENTFTAFSPDQFKESHGRMDFIWLGPTLDGKQPCQTDGYAVLPNVFDTGIYVSDHRAVVGDITLL